MENKGIVWETSGFEGLEISIPSLNWRTSLRVNGSAFGTILENEFNNLSDLFIFENQGVKWLTLAIFIFEFDVNGLYKANIGFTIS